MVGESHKQKNYINRPFIETFDYEIKYLDIFIFLIYSDKR